MSQVRIVEVGPRDGLQNEKIPIATELKSAFVAELLSAGLNEIEVTSFVSPKWVPQLADASEVLAGLPDGGTYSVLVPNLKGLDRAVEAGVKRIAIFTAASDAFTQKNINATVEESIAQYREVVERFREQVPDGWVRGYISTVVECPYAGLVDPKRVAHVAHELLHQLGVDELSMGETLGVASPSEVRQLIEHLEFIPKNLVAWHFHDTRGTAIANVAEALEHGYRAFDSSAGGLGGCPYAVGAGGNLATEDLVYFLEREGLETGVNLVALAQASLPILQALGRPPVAKSQVAALAACG